MPSAEKNMLQLACHSPDIAGALNQQAPSIPLATIKIPDSLRTQAPDHQLASSTWCS